MEKIFKGDKLDSVHFITVNDHGKTKTYQSMEEVSDGYHTFGELYQYRLLYNAAFFNMLFMMDSLNNPCRVVKSKCHEDGKPCFGGGWFIVQAELPFGIGQISNHYELKDWNLFYCNEVSKAPKWDGHTPEEAAERIRKFCLMSNQL